VVTIRNLMTHTSGYREFLNAYALAGTRLDEGDYIDPEWIIELVQRQPELQNEPGAEWNYNNTAFSLLTTIVARTTGEDYADWMDANIFTPLAMHDSFVQAHRNDVIKNKAQGYVRDEDGDYRAAVDLGASMGAGGIYTTVIDLAKWVRNYKSHTVGSAETWEQMTTPFELTGEDTEEGEDTGYGFGLFIDDQRGLERIHHGGERNAADAAARNTRGQQSPRERAAVSGCGFKPHVHAAHNGDREHCGPTERPECEHRQQRSAVTAAVTTVECQQRDTEVEAADRPRRAADHQR